MREIRLSGSEGGAGFIPRSYPYPPWFLCRLIECFTHYFLMPRVSSN